jgi:hypothetical protein
MGAIGAFIRQLTRGRIFELGHPRSTFGGPYAGFGVDRPRAIEHAKLQPLSFSASEAAAIIHGECKIKLSEDHLRKKAAVNEERPEATSRCQRAVRSSPRREPCYLCLLLASFGLISGLSYKTTFSKELWISSLPLYSM